MNKLKLNTPIFLLLALILSLSVFSVVAQINETENKQGNLDDNRNLVRVLRLINHLNKEADKQQERGFQKRAEMVRSYFQRKTGITDDAKLKLNELAENFQKEYENLSKQINNVGKSQKDSSDESKVSELEKLRESRGKLYDSTRQSLYNSLSKDDLENVLKFLREQILAKMKRADKSKSTKKFDSPFIPNLFKNISYEESLSGSFIEGYSWIEYDNVNNEVWSSSVTEGTCPVNNQESEPEYE
ncbi:MAG: hypothetical protein ACR2N3_04310 [Pyrinomonadaceae bacterium]